MGDGSVGFREAALSVAAAIPKGSVTTYGRIAAAIGHPRRARHVGMALAKAAAAGDYPCHRVVNLDGVLSGGWAFGHPDVMRQLLEEGVSFIAEHRVDLDACLWEPPDLTEGHRSRDEAPSPPPGDRRCQESPR